MARERLHTLHPLGMGRHEGMDPENRKTMGSIARFYLAVRRWFFQGTVEGSEPGVEPLP